MASFSPRGSQSFAHQQRIEDALREHEEVKWLGRPAAGSVGRPQRMAGLVGSLLLGLMTFQFFISHNSPLKSPDTSDRLGTLIGLSIMSLMAVFLIRVPWRRMKQLQHTLYLLSNQRVLILHPEKSRRDESLPLRGIASVEYRHPSKRSGEVILYPKNAPSQAAPGRSRETPLRPVRLRYLRQPQELARRIQDALPKAPG